MRCFVDMGVYLNVFRYGVNQEGRAWTAGGGGGAPVLMLFILHDRRMASLPIYRKNM